MDKNTLLQLRGKTALGYAFDRRYGPETISDTIYDDRIAALVESCFKVLVKLRTHGMLLSASIGTGTHDVHTVGSMQGYNATVLAYGQTGSGKTHTMSGGAGIHGKVEEGEARG